MGVAGLTEDDPKDCAAAIRESGRGAGGLGGTTVGTPWPAKHLNPRNAANASQQSRRHRRQAAVLARKLQKWMDQSISAA